jgi:hypothetical protein
MGLVNAAVPTSELREATRTLALKLRARIP